MTNKVDAHAKQIAHIAVKYNDFIEETAEDLMNQLHNAGYNWVSGRLANDKQWLQNTVLRNVQSRAKQLGAATLYVYVYDDKTITYSTIPTEQADGSEFIQFGLGDRLGQLVVERDKTWKFDEGDVIIRDNSFTETEQELTILSQLVGGDGKRYYTVEKASDQSLLTVTAKLVEDTSELKPIPEPEPALPHFDVEMAYATSNYNLGVRNNGTTNLTDLRVLTRDDDLLAVISLQRGDVKHLINLLGDAIV